MRRRRHDVDKLPRWLTDPRPADWPDPGCHWECRYWQAVSDWQRAHLDTPIPPDLKGPDAPFHIELI